MLGSRTVFPIVASLATILLSSEMCTAYFKRYMPLDDAELSHRVSQRRIPIKIEDGASVRVGGALINLEEGGTLTITGMDKAGLPWRFTGSWNAFGGGFFSADLDKSGTPDLIYAWNTGGNGLAPSMHITTLMFDHRGRPVPSQMDGYFEIDRNGIEDLVDLDGDGRAELIRQSWDDGYWITSLYEARGARWHRVEGEHAGRSFPLYTRFTTRSNRVATTPAPGRHPIEDDLSNDFPSHRSRLRSVKWANVAQSENPELVLDDGTVCSPAAWYSTMSVVLDTSKERIAATLSAPEEARALLETIRDRKLDVQITGKRRYAATGDHSRKPTRCVPETIWASAN
jgi:hypothetical protein